MTATDPTTAQPATPGEALTEHVHRHSEPVADCDWCPLPENRDAAPQPAQEPDHIIADTDQVEASILAEFEVSPLRDLALDLLHDLVQTRAEVRRLREQLDAAPAAPTTYALPPEPPETVTELWTADGAPVRRRTAEHGGWLYRGMVWRWLTLVEKAGPLSTAPPAGTEAQ